MSKTQEQACADHALNAFRTNAEYFRVMRDFHREHGAAAINAAELKLIDDWIGPRVLDAGCGEGSISRWLADRHPQSSVVGVDCSGVALRMARSSSASYPPARLRWMEASIKCLPFESSCFDLIICHSVLEHTPDYPAALREFARVLKPGGKLVALTGNSGRFQSGAARAFLNLLMGTTRETVLTPSFVQRAGSLADNQTNFDVTTVWSNLMLRHLRTSGFRVRFFTTHREAIWRSPVFRDAGPLRRLLIRLAYSAPIFPFTHLGPKILVGCEKLVSDGVQP